MAQPDSALLQLWLDRACIAETVQAERAARDQGQWDTMLSYWHADSEVDISWFKGSGPEFVAATQRVYEAGMRSLHQMSPTVSRVHGSKALAETGCVIVLHSSIQGTSAFMTSHSRLFERLVRHEDGWLLTGFRIVYTFDYLTPSNASDTLHLDPARLDGYRQSYRYASYLLAENGQTPNPDLAGPDRPETVTALLQAEQEWLLS